MTIGSMCDRFTATLDRQGSSRAADGSKVIAFTSGARTADGVPTSVRADFQTMTAEEKIEYGIKESEMCWCMFTATDPKLDTRDQVTWVDSGSISRVCRVTNLSFDMAGRARIWKTMVTESRTRT